MEGQVEHTTTDTGTVAATGAVTGSLVSRLLLVAAAASTTVTESWASYISH